MTDGGARERVLRAPAWLEELLRTTPPEVPWRDVVRFAVTIPAPIALAITVGGGLDSGAALGAVLLDIAAGAFRLTPDEMLDKVAARVSEGSDISLP